jgi:hypothetical protein
MNERIHELARRAQEDYVGYQGKGLYYEIFAKLIVEECINVSEAHAKNLEAQPCNPAFEAYEDGIVNGIYEATAAIKEHFGVEE